MGQAVEECGRHLGVSEDGGPFAEAYHKGEFPHSLGPERPFKLIEAKGRKQSGPTSRAETSEWQSQNFRISSNYALVGEKI